MDVNNLMEIIRNRRSIRKFSDREISEEDLNTIIEAGMNAPSGLNLQPWYFVAVKSEEKRKELYTVMNEVGDKIMDELNERFAAHPEIIAETQTFIKTLGKAPVVLLAFLLKDDYQDPWTATQSVAAAMENSLLAARALGIGSCWLTAATQAGLNEKVEAMFAPRKGQLIATAALGYPENDAWPKYLKRKEGRFEIL